ncbi:hypothetical protein PG996_016174 [Apiospora saccharicola]|uniref:Arrestin-like N-terminal domain-containing protein n=1 Tax=Apiospora saccharicola TaxID=335842 RepID=A0ABR1TQF2_9PEZI
MKLGIDTTPNGRGQVFPSSDIVTGAVHLDVHSSLAMSRIEFSIKVLLKSEETEAVGGEYAGHVRYLKLFQTSQVLFPRSPLDGSTRYTLGPGRHEYGFGVDLSLLAQCATAELRLKPWIQKAQGQQAWNTHQIFCTMCVAVKGCGFLRRRVRKTVLFLLVPLDPPYTPPQQQQQAYQMLPVGAFGIHADEVQREKERKEEAGPDDAADCLPSYSPAVTLKATITSDGGGLVYPGDALSLHLRLVVPASAQERLRDCCLSRVRLSLIDPTITNIGHRRVVNLFGTLIREVRMQLQLHQQAPSKCETIELDSALWEDCRIPRPTSTTHEKEGGSKGVPPTNPVRVLLAAETGQDVRKRVGPSDCGARDCAAEIRASQSPRQ